ncbi:MAG: DUF1549 domain-containing protein, partial [Planctomycetia bacterium]|nr:DUF1549 domain-containing protein [Planctomycetia bacterium]
MRCHWLLLPGVILAFATASVSATAADPKPDAKPDATQIEFFEKKVRPLLADHCWQCHGPDKQKGGLRLDSRDAVLAGGESGPAIVPSEPDKSRLVKAIGFADGGLQMPKKGKLSDADIAVLTAWVKMGAPWPETTGTRPATTSTFKITEKDREFWSFKSVKRPDVPQIRNLKSEIRNDIDNFVLAKLEEKGLKPAPLADKRTLIRRAYFDLIGLPPTPEEIDAFLRDDSPEAFAKVIDKLLASPHYGERWGRHWLDVARYGEDQAHTFQSRKYPDGWRYRDWVVKAFNEDLPYDQFVMMQIAGDLLEGENRPDRLAATG